MRILIHAKDALAMCDVARARRLDPTPEQTERARRNWHAAPQDAAAQLKVALARAEELSEALRWFVQEGAEEACDECGGDLEKCPSWCCVRLGRKLLEEGAGCR